MKKYCLFFCIILISINTGISQVKSIDSIQSQNALKNVSIEDFKILLTYRSNVRDRISAKLELVEILNENFFGEKYKTYIFKNDTIIYCVMSMDDYHSIKDLSVFSYIKYYTKPLKIKHNYKLFIYPTESICYISKNSFLQLHFIYELPSSKDSGLIYSINMSNFYYSPNLNNNKYSKVIVKRAKK